MLADMHKVERAARMSFMDFDMDEKAAPVAPPQTKLLLLAACVALAVGALALVSF